MATEFIVSTDEIRNKMFEFIKPTYKSSFDLSVEFIDWVCGVYDSDSRFFITFVDVAADNERYILISEKGDVFYIIVGRYRQHEFSDFPEKLNSYKNAIRAALRLYNNEIMRVKSCDGLLAELNRIREEMKDRCQKQRRERLSIS